MKAIRSRRIGAKHLLLTWERARASLLCEMARVARPPTIMCIGVGDGVGIAALALGLRRIAPGEVHKLWRTLTPKVYVFPSGRGRKLLLQRLKSSALLSYATLVEQDAWKDMVSRAVASGRRAGILYHAGGCSPDMVRRQMKVMSPLFCRETRLLLDGITRPGTSALLRKIQENGWAGPVFGQLAILGRTSRRVPDEPLPPIASDSEALHAGHE